LEFHHLRQTGQNAVKLVAEYLEEAIKFERMAAEASDSKLKELLQNQAAAYRKLADKRAAELHLPPVNLPVLKEIAGRPKWAVCTHLNFF
jgi:hypothetical protein